MYAATTTMCCTLPRFTSDGSAVSTGFLAFVTSSSQSSKGLIGCKALSHSCAACTPTILPLILVCCVLHAPTILALVFGVLCALADSGEGQVCGNTTLSPSSTVYVANYAANQACTYTLDIGSGGGRGFVSFGATNLRFADSGA